MTDSAIWFTCRDCGHTTRALARMANRVLKARTHCLECKSTCEPCLNRTPAGRGIALSPEQSLALREMDDKHVRAWLEEEARRSAQHSAPLQWARSAGYRLVDRFSKGGMAHSGRPQQEQAFHDTGTIGGTGSAAVRL